MGLSIPKVRKLLAEAKSDNIAPINLTIGGIITSGKPKKTHPNMLTGNCSKLYRMMKNKQWYSTVTIIRYTYVTCVSQTLQRLRDHGYPYECRRVGGHYEYRLK